MIKRTERIENYLVGRISPLKKIENKENREKRRREREQKIRDQSKNKTQEEDKGETVDVTV